MLQKTDGQLENLENLVRHTSITMSVTDSGVLIIVAFTV